MKVILLEEVKGKGGEGDVVDVAHGFAVNYLLPRRMAVEATTGNLKQLESRKHNIEKRELARTTDANTLREALDGKVVTIPAKVGEEGQLFGSITTAVIADAIAEQIGVTVDRKKVDVAHAIKTAGDHDASVTIYREIKAELTVKVVDIAAPADAAAEEAPAEETATEEAPVEEAATEEAPAEASAE